MNTQHCDQILEVVTNLTLGTLLLIAVAWVICQAIIHSIKVDAMQAKIDELEGNEPLGDIDPQWALGLPPLERGHDYD